MFVIIGENMQVNRITLGYSAFKQSKVSFEGHFRSVEVEALQDDVFQAKVAGSKTSVTYYSNPNEAAYKTIRKAKDYIPNSSIQKINDITIDKTNRLGVAEVYYSDRNEQINMEHVGPYADYIVYAPGSGIIIPIKKT